MEGIGVDFHLGAAGLKAVFFGFAVVRTTACEVIHHDAGLVPGELGKSLVKSTAMVHDNAVVTSMQIFVMSPTNSNDVLLSESIVSTLEGRIPFRVAADKLMDE